MRTGGRTTLVAGLVKAYEVLRRHRQRERQTQLLQGLLTDGHANVSFGTGDPVVDAFQHASRPRDAGVSTLIVDTEQGTMSLGLAQRVAAAAGRTCRASRIWPPASSRPPYACRSAAGAKAMTPSRPHVKPRSGFGPTPIPPCHAPTFLL